jgi:hypothetical protein
MVEDRGLNETHSCGLQCATNSFLLALLALIVVEAGTSCSLASLPGGWVVGRSRCVGQFAVEVRTVGIILEPSAPSPHLQPVEPIG